MYKRQHKYMFKKSNRTTTKNYTKWRSILVKIAITSPSPRDYAASRMPSSA
ncbi:hypothetical protein [Staphylococcus aureus]